MPRRPPTPCGKPGCGKLSHERFCDDHAREEKRELDRDRPSAARRGYGHRWRKLRLMVLREEPLCRDPFGAHEGQPVPATDVDHIMPRERGGTDARENLRPLCKRCHSEKTAREDGRWGGR